MKPATEFTVEPLEWEPYITPVNLDKATDAQRDALKITPSNKKISNYVLTLALDPESLAHRTPLFNAIMYGPAGLPRSERELGAVAASIVNHCIYCASTHAARYNQLTSRPEIMQEIFSAGTQAALDEHSQGLFDFAVHLSRTPPALSRDDVSVLECLGLTALQMFDLVLSAAIFGWANRLMHPLGQAMKAQ
ncbi:peroxidase-related enzyme [Nguyenibacter sp. L1]|uniref:peroxidase-related enzyme n=1 Tax=Nguyenibacter sp. L1 TaxID=3049350 RepID=UPI002B48445E|nr:peroxidase-related enzyme [Nguyenibacter sp. L1]WRH88949.1 peroxidase-related enzyme [Nguyenibacter sp. L1]